MSKPEQGKEPDQEPDQEQQDERNRVFQVSANRGRASHKLRYVESSLADTGDCRLCVGALSPDEEADADEKTTENDQDEHEKP